MLYECIGKYSKTTYTVPGPAIQVHSFEELAYVLSENIYSIGDFKATEELIAFIKDGLGLRDLAEQLTRRGRKSGDAVATILSYRHYMSDAKVDTIKGVLASSEEVQEYVRLVSRGDFMSEGGRLRPALILYEHAGELMETEEKTDTDEYRSLMEKLGKLYALFFCFKKAGDCFEKAGDARKAFYCRRLSMGRVEYADYLMTHPKEAAMSEEAEEMMKAAVPEIERLQELKSAGSRVAFESELANLTRRLKQDYRRNS